MRKTIRGRVVALTALAGLVAGCGEKGGTTLPPVTPPVPGVLTVALTTPNPNDRAVRLTITGPAISQVELAGSGLVLHQRSEGGVIQAALFGPITSGPVLRLTVPDVNRVAAYSVAIPEVADDTNALRAALPGYTATVSR